MNRAGLTLAAAIMLFAQPATAIAKGSGASEGDKPQTPIEAILQICEWRNSSQDDASKPPAALAAKVRELYTEAENAGNAYIDTLSLAVKHKKAKDPALKKAQVKLGEKITGLHDAIHSTGAGSVPNWPALILETGKEIFVFAKKMKQQERDSYAADIQTRCRWSTFDELNPPVTVTPMKKD
jgi:hypothetical protein